MHNQTTLVGKLIALHLKTKPKDGERFLVAEVETLDTWRRDGAGVSQPQTTVHRAYFFGDKAPSMHEELQKGQTVLIQDQYRQSNDGQNVYLYAQRIVQLVSLPEANAAAPLPAGKENQNQ